MGADSLRFASASAEQMKDCAESLVDLRAAATLFDNDAYARGLGGHLPRARSMPQGRFDDSLSAANMH